MKTGTAKLVLKDRTFDMKLLILTTVHIGNGTTYTYRKGHGVYGKDMEQVVKELLDHPDMLCNHTGTEYDWDEQTATISFKHTNPPDVFHRSYLKDGFRLVYNGTKPCDM